MPVPVTVEIDPDRGRHLGDQDDVGNALVLIIQRHRSTARLAWHAGVLADRLKPVFIEVQPLDDTFTVIPQDAIGHANGALHRDMVGDRFHFLPERAFGIAETVEKILVGIGDDTRQPFTDLGMDCLVP